MTSHPPENFIILIADDDPSDVFFLKKALQDVCPGATVISVEDGQDAIDYLQGKGGYSDRSKFPIPTHIFLDIKMPRCSGFEVLRWIRDHSNLVPKPVITVLSGSQIANDMEQVHALGAEYFVKPVEYAELLQKTREYFNRLSGRRGGEAG
jgi:CheY-like chemotaxis protein